jgi:hypothetical protein
LEREVSTKIEIIKHPSDYDWKLCKLAAITTVGKRRVVTMPNDEWKHKILRAEHSPIRTLMFTIRMEVPYWVSVHFVRHKYGVEHYVRSQRNDRQSMYDRTKAPQDAPVTHIMDVNAQELMQMARMRLCGQASPQTRGVMEEICEAVVQLNPEFKGLLVPKCVAYRGCDEYRTCGRYERSADAD